MSEKIKLTKEQVELIEQYAVMMEQTNLQPAMAKILALLNVADETELSFNQIQETLGLSKSGTSQAITHLLATDRIEYKTKLGDRKRYFYVPVHKWKDVAARHFAGLEAYMKLNQKILAQRSKKTKEFNDTLKEMTEFLSALYKVYADRIK
ncbi:MAG: hypothetical protein KIT66_11310 [Chitinophagaceae bacterium]|nr:hypothetical protein [Chitinophagaceae bacterium]